MSIGIIQRWKPAILVVVALGCLSRALEWPASVVAAEDHPIAAVIGQDAGLLAVWKDGEIRSHQIGATRETEVFLGLLPSGPYGTVTLVLSARLPRRPQGEPPGSLQVRAAVGMRVNPNVIRKPVLMFVLDAGSKQAITLDLSERLRGREIEPGTAIDNAIATMSLVEFIQLLRAESVTGQILGLDFSLTSKQRQALREFGDRILKPSG
jgi:hypothetical protein